MLKLLRHCACCGAEMTSVRSTKAYCSDACRKKVARGGVEQQTESRWIVECLRRLRLVAKIWPVYSWDETPPIFALMVTPQAALGELNLSGSPVPKVSFYDGRKDRRIKKGYTPTDNGGSSP